MPALAAALLLLQAAGGAPSAGPALAADAPAACAKCSGPLVYVGTHGPTIFAARLDERTGTLVPIGPAAEVEQPTWLLSSDRRPILYATSETGNDGKSQAHVVALAADRRSGKLTLLNSVPSGGGGATHLALDPRSRTLFVANFGTGDVAALPIAADGRLAPAASSQKDRGSGPHPRQKGPHAHGVAVDPGGRFVLSADLGADRTFIYRFDARTRSLTPGDPPFAAAAPGSGPRHATFLPGGRYAYVNSELTGEITAFRWNGGDGRLDPVATIATNAPGYAGPKSSAEMAASRDGRFLYASNRGEDTLVVYRVDGGSGRLSEVQRLSSGGEVPWSFAIALSGRWLIVANEASGSVRVFGVDRRSGRLTATGHGIAVPRPVSIAFVR